MDMKKAGGMYENYLNGNISDFKKELNKLSKKELIDFADFVNSINGIGLYLCSKYLESD